MDYGRISFGCFINVYKAPRNILYIYLIALKRAILVFCNQNLGIGSNDFHEIQYTEGFEASGLNLLSQGTFSENSPKKEARSSR